MGALAKFNKHDIFSTDQGSQFTSLAFTNVLQKNSSYTAMNGRSRWLNNVFIKRLRRLPKYGNVYLHAYETESEALTSIGKWLGFTIGSAPAAAWAVYRQTGRFDKDKGKLRNRSHQCEQ